MDWIGCRKKGVIKKVKMDVNRINSLIKIAENKIEAGNVLPSNLHYSKISLLYDAIRTFLECIALRKGYKMYNHECYVSFLKEVMNESSLGDEFDEYRIIRNGINYYGREMDETEGKAIIKNMLGFLEKVKKLL